ncbi:hypothetical protein FRB98_009275 [Tulasnella sp. 332]|nr:hypothetical protein FRB98_009275 [Tulasnella sp. 332]
MSSPATEDSLTSLDMSPSPEAVGPASPTVKGAGATTALGRKPGVGGSDASSDLSELSSDGEAQRDHTRQYKKPRHSSVDLDEDEDEDEQEDEDGELPSSQTASSSKRGLPFRRNGLIVQARISSQPRMRIKSSSSTNTTTTTTATRRPQSPSKSIKASRQQQQQQQQQQRHHSPTISKPNGTSTSSSAKPPSRAPTHARHTRTMSESLAGGGGASCAVAGPSSLNGHLNHPSAFAISAGLVGPTIGGDSDDDDDDLLSGGRRSSRRNKRGVVPGPMWDWAIKKMPPNHSSMKKESSKSQRSNDEANSGTNTPPAEDHKVGAVSDIAESSTIVTKDDEDVKPDLASLSAQGPPPRVRHASESAVTGPSTTLSQSRAPPKSKRVRKIEGDPGDSSNHSDSDSNMSLATPPDPSHRRPNPKKGASPRVPPSRSPSPLNRRSASPSEVLSGKPKLEDGTGEVDGTLAHIANGSVQQPVPSTSTSSAFSLSVPNSGDEAEPKHERLRRNASSQAPNSALMSSDEEKLAGGSPQLAAKKTTPSREVSHAGLHGDVVTTKVVPAMPLSAPRGSMPLPVSPVAAGRPRGGSSLDLLADVIGTATGGARAGIDLHMSREVKEEAVMMEIEEAHGHTEEAGKNKDGNGDDNMEVDADEQDDATAKEKRDDGEDEQESEEDDADPDAEVEADTAAPGRQGQNEDDEDDDDAEDDDDGRRRRRPGKPTLVTPDDNEVEEEEENEPENRESDHEDSALNGKHAGGNGIQKGDDGAEAEEEAEAEHDHEVENEIQPTQRAEALEILAAMELKFAMLRQRIYLDKMHETAREEKMLLEGTHPEYLTLLAELQRRRDRKLNLSELRRTKEEEFSTHQRKADEQAVWRQWNETKDDIRDELVAEANSKRRRLEREKRHVDAPKPVRAVHMPPAPSRSRRPPSPQSLKQTLKMYAKQTKRNRTSTSPPLPGQAKAVPNLESLSLRDAASDLDLILGSSRRSSAATAVHHQAQQPVPAPVQQIHPQQVPPHPQQQQQQHAPHPPPHPHPHSQQQQMMYAPPPPPNGYPPMHGYPHPQQQHGPPPHQRYMTPAGYGHPADYGSNGAGPYQHHPSMVPGGYADGGGYDPYAPPPPGVQHYPGQPPPQAPQQHYPPHQHPSQLPPPQQYHQQYHPQYAPQPPHQSHGQQYLHQPQPQRYILPPSDVAIPPPPPPGYQRHNWPPPHAVPPPPQINGPPNPNQNSNPNGRDKVMIDLTNVPSPAPMAPHRSDQPPIEPSGRDRQRPPIMSPSRALGDPGAPPPRPGSSLLAPIPTPHHDPRPTSAVSHFTSTPRPHRDHPPPSAGTPGIQSAVSPFKQPLSPSREIPAPIGPGYPLQSPTRTNMTTPVSSVGGAARRQSQSPNLMMRGPPTPLSQHGIYNGLIDVPTAGSVAPPPALSNGVVDGS